MPFNDLEQCKLPRWILDCTLKVLKGFIFTYHQCRKWNIEATAARSCYLDWAGEKPSRCWIHQRGSCFTPNTPLCHLHNKRFDLYFCFFHEWMMTSCSSTFTSTQKHCHVEQRLSRFPWKRRAITHERSLGAGVSRGNQSPGWSLLAVQPHTSGVCFPRSASASPSRLPMKTFRMYSHLERDRENPIFRSPPAATRRPHPIRKPVSWLPRTAFPVVVVEVWKLELISAFAGASGYLYTLAHAWNSIISKPMCM